MGAAGPSDERDRKSTPPISPGDVLLGKYRVERVLGEGSMGTIFAARHVEQGELYALKVLTAKALASSQAVERFLREARALAKLRGPHVAAVHEIARLPTGAPCMVMEYLHGSDLQELLRTHPRPPIHDALEWMIQACDGVAEAHALDIVHRDIKPANLFVGRLPDGRSQVRVLDFGIAKLAERDGPFETELTQVGMVFGTPSYMSPEQMRQTKDVDGRTDIWSLGVVLYEILTGALPFSPAAGPMDLALRISVEAPIRPAQLRPDTPPALDDIVMRCLEKSPERRFQTAPLLSEALRAVLASLPAGDRGSLVPVPPAPVSARGIPAPPPSVRAPVSMRGTPVPIVGAAIAPEKRAFPRWLAAVIAALVAVLIAVPALLLAGGDPEPVAGVASALPAGSTSALAPDPGSTAPAESVPSGSTAAAPTAAPSAPPSASQPTAPRPSVTSPARPKPKSPLGACSTTADCRRGQRCIQKVCR